MKGKVGLVIGLAAGYVLGTRAGRERYEQIKTQAVKVWNLDPVQDQVDKAKDIARSSAMALPSALWQGAVKVTKAATTRGTPGERLDAALATGKDSADDVEKAAKTSAHAVAEAARDAAATASEAVKDAGATASETRSPSAGAAAGKASGKPAGAAAAATAGKTAGKGKGKGKSREQ